ncbi:MAG: hypothetical protein ACPH9K_06930 [Candidatus Poseidoniaceae archaeon]
MRSAYLWKGALIPMQTVSNNDGDFACSQYGEDWAGPDGDRLTLAIALLKQLPSGSININSFESRLDFPTSVGIQELIEASTNWTVNEDSQSYLHGHSDSYLVAITSTNEEPIWPSFSSSENKNESQQELVEQWSIEVQGVSQGAYVSQAQHIVASSSRLGLKAQNDHGTMVWPPRQLNSDGTRIESSTNTLSEPATILTWTRLSAAGAPSEFSGRAPLLDGVSTVLVAFEEGPKGVFMLADDEHESPEIDGKVRFEVRRLYGQDGMMHYGLKAVLCQS